MGGGEKMEKLCVLNFNASSELAAGERIFSSHHFYCFRGAHEYRLLNFSSYFRAKASRYFT